MHKKNFVKLLAFTITLAVIIFFYHKILFSPECYLTTDDGDGIKAYNVFAGHIRNDVSYNQFTNMNYPYGQTHIFTDGQTVIADLFKWLSSFFPFFRTHCIALINLMMLLSYPFCTLFLCSIIQRLRLPGLFTVLGSIAITLLSPQIFRIFGHITLSYVVFFPLSWWLFIRFNESIKKKYIWSALIAANSIFWFFVHPYFIMINSIFYVAYWFVGFIQNNSKKNYFRSEIISLIIHTVIPLIITRLYVVAVDIHKFRSEEPWGFWMNYARWNTIFMPNHLPFHPVYKQFFSNLNQNWEGWAYIGLPAVIITLFVIVKIVRYCLKKNFRLIVTPILPPVLKTAVLASYLVLLFSMCLPFQLGMHFLVDWLPFIKQFRSLGRFAWVFYYVYTVFGLYFMFLAFRYLKIKKHAWAAYLVAAFYFVIYFAEAIPYHQEGRENTSKGVNYFDHRYLPSDYRELISEIESVKEHYQCIIPLPFYHIGSENFGKEFTSFCIRSSMVVSYWTNMPLLASSTARSPILEAKNIMQFFSPSWFKKEIQKDLPSKKDFLILYTKEELTAIESQWLQRSNKIYSNTSFELWSLPYEKVFKDNSIDELQAFQTKKDSLFQMNSFYTSQKSDTIIYNSFDDKKSKFIYRGKGAVESKKKDFTMLLPRGHYNLKNDREYVVSFWYYNKDELRNTCTCIIEQCDANGNNCNWEIAWSPSESMTIDGDWSLVEKKFRLKNSDEQIAVLLNGDSHSRQEIFIDEFLIRDAETNIYQTVDNTLIKNNIRIGR